MGITRGKVLDHWLYFLALEDDLLRLSRYVDFSGNDNAYSLEIARVLMAASAEADVILKELCARWDPGASASTIGGYQAVIASQRNGFKSFRVVVPRFGLALKPWSGWGPKQSPRWWTANNKVKHQRHTHFSQATLKHCLNAAAGLFVALLYFYPYEARSGELVPPSRLWDVDDRYSLGQFIDRWGAVPMVDVPASQ